MGLLVTCGAINGIKCKIIVDLGAELNHISSDFCKHNGIEIKLESRIAVVENKSEMSVDLTLNACIVSIGQHSESMNLVVTKLLYDLVLGKNGYTNIAPRLTALLTRSISGIKVKHFEFMLETDEAPNKYR